MTLDDLKIEVSACLRVGPSGWTKAAQDLQPATKFIVASSRSKQPLHERRIAFMQRYGPALINEDEEAVRNFFSHTVGLLQAQIYGQRDYREARTKLNLETWPAAELSVSKEEPAGWRDRWIAAGGTIKGRRAFALKSSGVWATFNDFGQSFEPFDWGDNFVVEDASKSDFEERKNAAGTAGSEFATRKSMLPARQSSGCLSVLVCLCALGGGVWVMW